MFSSNSVILADVLALLLPFREPICLILHMARQPASVAPGRGRPREADRWDATCHQNVSGYCSATVRSDRPIPGRAQELRPLPPVQRMPPHWQLPDGLSMAPIGANGRWHVRRDLQSRLVRSRLQIKIEHLGSRDHLASQLATLGITITIGNRDVLPRWVNWRAGLWTRGWVNHGRGHVGRNCNRCVGTNLHSRNNIAPILDGSRNYLSVLAYKGDRGIWNRHRLHCHLAGNRRNLVAATGSCQQEHHRGNRPGSTVWYHGLNHHHAVPG
jgi:hypothetical protein